MQSLALYRNTKHNTAIRIVNNKRTALDVTVLNFNLYCRAIIIKNYMVLVLKKKHVDQWYQIDQIHICMDT